MRCHERRSPRWRPHDYRRAGLYFVTICTAGRREVFGRVVDGQVRLSRLGAVAEAGWARTFELRPTLLEDASVVMPNHVHLLFGIIDDDIGATTDGRDTMHGVPTGGVRPGGVRPGGVPTGELRRFGQHLSKSVSSIMNGYKAAVTREARRLGLWPEGPLWQGRFHDRVVRDAAEADRIRRYIAENPARWDRDRLHPDRLPPPRRRSGQ